MTSLFLILNGLMMSYILLICFLIFTQGNRPGQQQIEIWGLYIGFGFPLGTAILHFLIKRKLVCALLDFPAASAAATATRNTDRDAVRDVDRDKLRDRIRDAGRDVSRDVARDTQKDVDKKRGEEGEEKQ